LNTLFVGGPIVTDAALKDLEGCKSLRSLNLSGTNVTDAGIAALRKAHPRLYVSK
jgi:hypothetical protein